MGILDDHRVLREISKARVSAIPESFFRPKGSDVMVAVVGFASHCESRAFGGDSLVRPKPTNLRRSVAGGSPRRRPGAEKASTGTPSKMRGSALPHSPTSSGHMKSGVDVSMTPNPDDGFASLVVREWVGASSEFRFPRFESEEAGKTNSAPEANGEPFSEAGDGGCRTFYHASGGRRSRSLRAYASHSSRTAWRRAGSMAFAFTPLLLRRSTP